MVPFPFFLHLCPQGRFSALTGTAQCVVWAEASSLLSQDCSLTGVSGGAMRVRATSTALRAAGVAATGIQGGSAALQPSAGGPCPGFLDPAASAPGSLEAFGPASRRPGCERTPETLAVADLVSVMPGFLSGASSCIFLYGGCRRL